ncbi:MAG TPA: ChbG/HpnK family deacetylase [Terriglobales bacterium]|nr:ChbG/HpnK family deacetylase [Terriglobales bacterium]
MQHNKIHDQSSVQPRKSVDAEFSRTKPGSQEELGGCLIINADDWGQDVQTTDRIFDCFRSGVLSSASGMVFMEDSERAAAFARQQDLDIGLHLNLSDSFSASNVPVRLLNHHEKVRHYLCASPFTRLIYHPGLASSFEYVIASQLEEFARLYGRQPNRIDGHHHMHLSANVMLPRLLPLGTIVRRHFSYERGEKVVRNSAFRFYSSAVLARGYQTTDFLFSLPPLAPFARLERIFTLATNFIVEVETHPAMTEEYRFLTGGNLLSWVHNCTPVPAFDQSVARCRKSKHSSDFISCTPEVV